MWRGPVGVSLLLLIATQTVHADESATARQKAARVLWVDGQAAYNTERYDEAIDLYLRAYKLNPDPLLLMNLAQCYRKKRDHERAIFYFRGYLRSDPNTTRRAEVEKIMSIEEDFLQQERTNDNKPPEGVEPPAQDINKAVAPDAENQPQRDRPKTIEEKLTQPADTTPAWYEDRLAWVVAGTGAVAAVTGAAYLFSAAFKRSDAEAARNEFSRQQLNEEADSRQRIGIVTIASGGIVTALGVGMLIYNPDRRPSVSVSVSRSSVSLGLGVAF